MTKDEALKLALESLENTTPTGFNMERDKQFFAAITAIKEALSQPEDPCKGANYSQASEQEPSELDVWKARALQAEAVIKKFMAQPEPVIDKSSAIRIATSLGWEPKRTWVGLTDEDKQIAFDDTQEGGGFWEFADAIEAKLKEKNT